MLMLRILSSNSFRPALVRLSTRSSSSSSSSSSRISRSRSSSRSIPSQSTVRWTTTTTTTQLEEGGTTQLEEGGTPRKQKRKSARARKKEREKGLAGPKTLEWESFDFSTSPKWDKRFDEDNDSSFRMASTSSLGEDWEKLEEEETQEDIALQKRFAKEHQLWESLDPQLVEDATNLLLPFISGDRWDKIVDIMGKRTQQTRFLFENPANPSNVWACMRTLDSFGIQHVDVVIQSGKFKGKAAISQKRGMRTAMGSAKWLSVKNHLSTQLALDDIKREDYHIVCADVNPDSKDIRDVDWDASGKKLCVVMGNEQRGISEEVKAMADESFYLPMVGMAESFNLSVATSITCAHLSAASTGVEGKGPLREGDLSEQEYKLLLLKGGLNSIRHKTAGALFRRHGLDFPKDLNIT
jgi:tRNA (guanosine-2'-O-)-methyltransferase